MKRKSLSFLLAICLCLQFLAIGAASPPARAEPLDSVGNTSVEARSAEIDGTVYQGTLSTGNTYFAYVPDNAAYGDRATSSPILIVYGDEAYTTESAKETALASGLAAIADIEHCPVIFVNPLDEGWAAEDAATYLAIRAIFSDTSTGNYQANEGKTAGESGKYPGYCSRMIVFAEGAGADFAYEYLAPGVEGGGQFFGTAIWKPVSLFLMNPASEEEIDLAANTAREVPVYIVNGDEAVAAAFNALNDDANVTAETSGTLSGFDRDKLLSAYDSVLEHWYTRDMGGTITLLPIPDYDELGMTVTRVDRTPTGASKVLTFYTFVPGSVSEAEAGTIPLMVTFHGSGNTAEAQVWTTGMAQLAASKGFIIASFDDYNTFTNAQIKETIDLIISDFRAIDTSRIYISGFSMGSMKTANLGSEYADFFAGSIMMNGFAGPAATAQNLIMPVFAIGGSNSHIRAFEFATSYPNAAIDYIFGVNGVTRGATFDPAYTWGTKPSEIKIIPATDITNPALSLEISYFESAGGNVYTALTNAATAGHEPLSSATAAGWDFISQFSRNSDGSIAIDGEGSHTTATARAGYVGDTSVETPSETLTGTVYDAGTIAYSSTNDANYAGGSYSSTAFVYVPTITNGAYGDRPTASPILIVYGVFADADDVTAFMDSNPAFKAIADAEHGPIVFVNPSNGTSWRAVDATSILAVKNLFSDSSSSIYTEEGYKLQDPQDSDVFAEGFDFSSIKTVYDGTGEIVARDRNAPYTITGVSYKYPGTATRIYVFADGAAADFAYERLASGVNATPQYFFAGTLSTWKPAAMFLSNPKSDLAISLSDNTARKVPVYIVNSTAAITNKFNALNGATSGMTALSSSPITTGFDNNRVLDGYNTLMEHWFTRDASKGVSLLNISDLKAAGVTETRESFTSGDATVRYYQYIPESASEAEEGTVPLVFGFHGGGNGAEFYAWSSGWAELVASEGFMLVTVQDHTPVDIIPLLDHLLIKYSFLDESRVYASGFSMGSMKSWGLGSSFIDRFAGIVPQNAFSGAAAGTVSDKILPVYYNAGTNSHLAGMEFPSELSAPLLSYIFEINGVAKNYVFDSTKTWGKAADSTKTLTDPALSGVTMTVYDFKSADGRVYTKFADATWAIHEPLRALTADGWAFIKQFSRNEDGSIAINGVGSHTTLTASTAPYVPSVPSVPSTGFKYPAAGSAGSLDNFKKDGTYNGFKDVNEDAWYGANETGAVKAAVELTIMVGDAGANTFRPTDSLSIAEALKMAAVVHNIYYGGSGEFDTAQGSHWYDVFVQYCIDKGIIKSGDFSSYMAEISRGQMAYVFANCLPASEFKAINTVTYIPDYSESGAYYGNILTLYKAGIAVGDADTHNFRAGDKITRAEAAAIISRVCILSERLSVTITN